jgi:hypothetical protein
MVEQITVVAEVGAEGSSLSEERSRLWMRWTMQSMEVVGDGMGPKLRRYRRVRDSEGVVRRVRGSRRECAGRCGDKDEGSGGVGDSVEDTLHSLSPWQSDGAD